MSLIDNLKARFKAKQDAVRSQKLAKTTQDAERARSIIREERRISENKAIIKKARDARIERNLGPAKKFLGSVASNIGKAAKAASYDDKNSIWRQTANNKSSGFGSNPFTSGSGSNPFNFSQQQPKQKKKRRGGTIIIYR